MRQVLWLSVVLYKSPESELTCCLVLSTDAIYFLLEDSASTLGHQSGGMTSDWICCHIIMGRKYKINLNTLPKYYFHVSFRLAVLNSNMKRFHPFFSRGTPEMIMLAYF